MKRKLEKVRRSLRRNIMLKISTGEPWEQKPWTISLVTDRNNYPYWLKWHGSDPEKLLDEVVAYLTGNVKQPHGSQAIPYMAWLADASFIN